MQPNCTCFSNAWTHQLPMMYLKSHSLHPMDWFLKIIFQTKKKWKYLSLNTSVYHGRNYQIFGIRYKLFGFTKLLIWLKWVQWALEFGGFLFAAAEQNNLHLFTLQRFHPKFNEEAFVCDLYIGKQSQLLCVCWPLFGCTRRLKI